MANRGGKGEARAFRGGLSSARQIDMDARAAEFEHLYRESYPVVYGRVLFCTRDEDVAHDVTAEAFLRAARYFNKFDPSKAKFSTWVNAIARNCIAEHFRKRKTLISIDDAPESALAIDTDPARDIADTDLVRQLLSLLDEVDRDIVFMKFCEERSNIEIAHELDMNPSTVASRVQRALEKMRAAAKRGA